MSRDTFFHLDHQHEKSSLREIKNQEKIKQQVIIMETNNAILVQAGNLSDDEVWDIKVQLLKAPRTAAGV